MELYNQIISDTFHLLDKYEGRCIESGNLPLWKEAKEQNLILRSDMAYELGGDNKAAVSGLAFTSSKELVEKDEIILYGPDLNKLAANSPYARITFVRVNTKD